MKLPIKKLIGAVTLVLLLAISMSTDALGQGRGRRAVGLDKKCGKFVNCHDARDGRWDGRGPRRNNVSIGNIFRRNRRNRDRDWDRDRRVWRRHRNHRFDR
jgi:hypothetical protein